MATELSAAVEAARAAGEVLRRGFGRDIAVGFKGLVDLVTEADLDAERVIKQVLSERFPAYGFWAEESGRSEGEADARWIIDPIDGTTNYAHGVPLVATSIGLQKAGEVVLGVVYNPLMEEMYVGERGKGATLNGEPLRVSDTEEMIRALLVSGFPYERDRIPATLELWGKFTMLSQGMRRLGSAALDVCWVAAGRFDAYYERGVFAWDIAAGSLILTEAGGTVTNYDGSPLDLDRREIVATNGRLHPAMIELTRTAP